jgi:hypothetical protein
LERPYEYSVQTTMSTSYCIEIDQFDDQLHRRHDSQL